MTDEDLQQIRTVIREEITAQHLVSRADLDAAVESIAADFSELRQEMNTRFDHVDRRFDNAERRLDRVETQLYTITISTAA